MTNLSGSLFEDIRCMEEEMDELFGRMPWPAGMQQNLLTVAGERTQSVERQTPRAMICRFS